MCSIYIPFSYSPGPIQAFRPIRLRLSVELLISLVLDQGPTGDRTIIFVGTLTLIRAALTNSASLDIGAWFLVAVMLTQQYPIQTCQVKKSRLRGQSFARLTPYSLGR